MMGMQEGAADTAGSTTRRTEFCRRGKGLGLGGLLLVVAAGVHAAERTELPPRPFNTPTTLPVAPFVPAAGAVAQAVPGGAVTDSANPMRSSATSPTYSSQPQPVMQWEVKASDITLLRTIERWAGTAGYKLKWDAAKNFLIGAPDVYTGTFEMALQSVLSSSGIRLSDYPLEACIYANTPPLVRITRQGEQARECSAVE